MLGMFLIWRLFAGERFGIQKYFRAFQLCSVLLGVYCFNNFVTLRKRNVIWLFVAKAYKFGQRYNFFRITFIPFVLKHLQGYRRFINDGRLWAKTCRNWGSGKRSFGRSRSIPDFLGQLFQINLHFWNVKQRSFDHWFFQVSVLRHRLLNVLRREWRRLNRWVRWGVREVSWFDSIMIIHQLRWRSSLVDCALQLILLLKQVWDHRFLIWLIGSKFWNWMFIWVSTVLRLINIELCLFHISGQKR